MFDFYNSSKLFKAIEDEDIETINRILSDTQFKLCDFENKRTIALRAAIVKNKINVVKVLLNNSVSFDDFNLNFNTMDSRARISPLDIAIRNENFEIIKLLCKKINSKNCSEMLYSAIARNKVEICKIILAS